VEEHTLRCLIEKHTVVDYLNSSIVCYIQHQQDTTPKLVNILVQICCNKKLGNDVMPARGCYHSTDAEARHSLSKSRAGAREVGNDIYIGSRLPPLDNT
jgi:hypothetical protein